MLDSRFVILGFAINLVGSASYIKATIKGQVKPNRVTYFMWSLAPLIAFSAQIHEGVGLRSLLAFSAGFIPLLVLVASFVNPKSVWKLTAFDFVCGALSLAGLAMWLATGKGNVAIAFSIVADGLACLPTIVKSYTHPETENWHGYFAGAINAGITLLTINNWTFASFGFPLYILLACMLLTFLVYFKPGPKVDLSTVQ